MLSYRMLIMQFFLLLLGFCAFAQQYQIEVDLNSVQDNKLKVVCYTPKPTNSQTKYYMPAIVPGTYSIYDFGRYVMDFKAYTHDGQPLEVVRESVNSWQIKNSMNLGKITYTVEDTWRNNTNNLVFEPAGTSFEKDKVFVLNPHALFGYLENLKNIPYQITLRKPSYFYGSTALKPIDADSLQDVFLVENYTKLADSPILYCRADTSTLWVGDAEVLVSVYSPNSLISSQFIASELSSLLTAQKEYLGGKLPISKYAFLFYFTDQSPKSGLIGALEHSYSSFYFLLETLPGKELVQSIKDIAAHEFFHIITPLSIHSEEIHDFDFISPKMSKHLWLYEGATEYAATHMQVKHGLISQQDYLNLLAAKIQGAASYQKNLPFTELSRHCLDKHKRQYGNVYEKGALIAAFLDITLLENSAGQYGLQQLMADLSKYYGKDKPFKDDELFDKITEIANQSSLRKFFTDYVEGTLELPYENFFAKVGIQYAPTKNISVLDIGKIEIKNSEKGLIITKIYSDKTTKKIGYKQGDIILQINNQPVDKSNINQLVQQVADSRNNITVLRAQQKITLPLPRKPSIKQIKNYMAFSPTATEAQKKLASLWLTVKQN